MQVSLDAVWRLTRFKEYAWFVIITTLLGATAAHGFLGPSLVVVLIANWCAVGFAFMINDIEDAPDDALSSEKAQRNPVSSGDISPRTALLLSFFVALLAAILYATLGMGPFLAGGASLILGFLYSSRRIRLKAIPIADLASHALFLSALQFLTAYLAFDGGTIPQWAGPLALIIGISLYGQLFNELRDFEGDREAGLRHTASILGRRRAHVLMMFWLFVGVVSAAVSFFVVQLVPSWVLLLALALTLLGASARLPGLRRADTSFARQGSLQKSVEIASAIALLVWFAGPFVEGLVS